MDRNRSLREHRPASAALANPLRILILAVADERDVSPKQFFLQRLAFGLEASQPTFSTISYHFRALAELGCLEPVKTVNRGGAIEHFYRGSARAHFTDEEWVALAGRERRMISRARWRGLIARAESAMMSRSFDSRPDRHLTCDALLLDERGWKETMGVLADAHRDIAQLDDDARDRLAVSGGLAVPATVAMLGFESPPMPGA